MKDNWIKAFQDKLGDYELDIPAAAPRRPFVRYWLLIPAAAAAAALLFLLLRTPEASAPEASRPYLADASVRLSVTPPVLTDPQLLTETVRHHGSAPGQALSAAAAQASVAEGTGTAAEPATAGQGDEAGNGPADHAGNATPSANESRTDSPAAFDRYGFAQEMERMNDAHSVRPMRLSARLHVTPLSLQNLTASALANNVPTFSAMSSDAPAGGSAIFTPYYAVNFSSEHTNLDPVSRMKDEARCYLPARTGLAFRIETGSRLWIESGIDYSLHRAVDEIGSPILPAYQREFRMHYLGIPIKAGFRIAGQKQLKFYTVAGGEVELMAGGSLRTQANAQIQTQKLSEHPLLYSLTAAVGAEYNFTRFLGIYAEPGGAWHFKPQGNLPNYYREHPFSFDLHVGLRFNLRSTDL